MTKGAAPTAAAARAYQAVFDSLSGRGLSESLCALLDLCRAQVSK